MILNDHVAMVTGASQGIGKACAHIVAIDINAPNAEATAEAAGAFQRRSLALAADVGDLQDIDRIVRQTMEKFGRVDIMDLTEQDWDQIH
jgi:3-oxoacyl-[acyl-carrier protein] reductase